MKFFYKLIFLGLVGLLAVPMFITGPDGKPMMTIDDWIPDVDSMKGQVVNLGAVVSEKAGSLASSVPGSSTIGAKDAAGGQNFYKWKDANGVWQYSDKPNPAGNSDEVYVRPDTNVVSSEGFQPKPRNVKQSAGKSFGIKTPNPLTAMGQVPKMLDDIEDIQKQMDDKGDRLKDL